MIALRQEEWKPIKGYEGCYEVSTEGRVRSLPRSTVNWAGCKAEPKLMGLAKGKKVTVSLHKDGRLQVMAVHRIVAETFLPNPRECSDVMHVDGNRLNNRVDNLQWGTRKENFANAKRLGLRKVQARDWQKVDPAVVREMYRSGMKQTDIAKSVGITQSRVSVILAKGE